MVLTRRQLARARRWLPLWSLLMVLMSFGSRAATDLCTLAPHCSQSERSLTVAWLEPDMPAFISPSLFMPEAPLERLERPPRQIA